MRARSIRFRLTIWYSAVLGLALALFGAGTWIAMRESLYEAVDEELRDRVEGVRRFLDEQTDALSLEEVRDEFREHSVLGPGGDLFQVCDTRGVWLYRSAWLAEREVAGPPPDRLAGRGRYEDLRIAGASLRLLSERVLVRGEPYSVQVAARMVEMQEALDRFRWMLLLLAPLALAVASAGGYWLSRRALAPVDAITHTARSISARSLGRRLEVPRTGDELERLSATLNEMLEGLESAFRRVTQFTGDASHELRTPVALIRTAAELALRKVRSPEEYQQTIRQMLAESERASEMIENLLTLARSDSGMEFLELAPIDLRAVLAEAGGQGRRLAYAKGLEFDVMLPAAATIMNADRQAVRRLMLIMIDNAVKYSSAPGRVELSLHSSDGFVNLEVRDTGIGIAGEDLPHIFERFYRADKARARQMGGAGLGLSIARWIAEAHGGQIQAESAPGRGSTFRVRLPMGEARTYSNLIRAPSRRCGEA